MDSAVGVDSENDDPNIEEERYPGPPYDEWDDSIKRSVVDHLKDLGITENFSKLLLQFATAQTCLEAQRCILDDVPPEFNVELAGPDREAFLARVLPLRAEPVMAYGEELARVGLTEAVEGCMRDKPAFSEILNATFDHRLELLRSVVMFWIMEAERVQAAASKEGTPVRSAAECIAQLLHAVQHDMPRFKFVFTCLLDYVRFPCKETKLYLQTLMSLMTLMNPEMKDWVNKQLNKKPLFKYFERKQFDLK